MKKYANGEFEPYLIYSAWAWSGGPLEQEIYLDFKQKAVEALENVEELAGIYVSLHGAMGVEGMRDPESDFLQAIRDVVGMEMPLAVSFDLHANVTAENVRLASFIVGYHTNPHRDHRSTGYRATKTLLRAVRGEVKPTTAFRKMRLLKGGGWGIDFLPPMRGIFRRMKKMERTGEALIASNFWVHIWIDDEELGWSTVVTTDNDMAEAERLAEKLADMNWAVRKRKHPTPKSVEEAIRIAKGSTLQRRLGTVTFCDVSDVVGAGAPGGNTNILIALMKSAPGLKSYVPVRDPEAAVATFDNNEVGDELTVTVGGRIDPEYNPEVDFTGEIVFKRETNWGKTTLIRHKGLHMILTEMPFPAYFPEDFKQLGVKLFKADIIVVKNLFPFRFRFLRYNRRTVNVITRGITNVNVAELDYVKIPRPIYPLD
ncbi:MAG: M81 family metallopeptidase, partial [Bacteroidota bacterium]